MLAQSGTFVAFNLCEMPIKKQDNIEDELDLYPHINLEKVQEFYFQISFKTMSVEHWSSKWRGLPAVKAIMDATLSCLKS